MNRPPSLREGSQQHSGTCLHDILLGASSRSVGTVAVAEVRTRYDPARTQADGGGADQDRGRPLRLDVSRASARAEPASEHSQSAVFHRTTAVVDVYVHVYLCLARTFDNANLIVLMPQRRVRRVRESSPGTFQVYRRPTLITDRHHGGRRCRRTHQRATLTRDSYCVTSADEGWGSAVAAV